VSDTRFWGNIMGCLSRQAEPHLNESNPPKQAKTHISGIQMCLFDRFCCIYCAYAVVWCVFLCVCGVFI